jgi:hypothetical protein
METDIDRIVEQMAVIEERLNVAPSIKDPETGDTVFVLDIDQMLNRVYAKLLEELDNLVSRRRQPKASRKVRVRARRGRGAGN